MQAMRLHQTQAIHKNPLVLSTNLPELAPEPGQIRVRVHVCGVCHTDLQIAEGKIDVPSFPITPGHQIVGQVEALGIKANKFHLGQRVGVGWLSWVCGNCQFCKNGLENLCPQARFTGLHQDGGYAQYCIVDERFAFALPDIFSNEEAAPLLCAGIIGYRSLLLSNIQPGQRLGLYGFGSSAHLVIQIAKHWGCEVYVFTRSSEKRELAESLGADWVGHPQHKAPHPLSASISFAPAGWIIPLALEQLQPAGTLAINAIHLSPIPEIPYNLLYNERIVRSVSNFTRQNAEDFLKLAAEIQLKTHTHGFALAEANAALTAVSQSQIQGAAVLHLP